MPLLEQFVGVGIIAIINDMPELSNSLCACGCGRFTNIVGQTKKRDGAVAGEPRRYVRGHAAVGRVPHNYGKRSDTDRYRVVMRKGGGFTYSHRLRAENAIGKPLPAGAIVHHVDGSQRDESDLVICQDQKYHLLLHMRMRTRAAGGDPWTDKLCQGCRKAKPKAQFSVRSGRGDGLNETCRSCRSIAGKQSYARSKSSAAAV